MKVVIDFDKLPSDLEKMSVNTLKALSYLLNTRKTSEFKGSDLVKAGFFDYRQHSNWFMGFLLEKGLAVKGEKLGRYRLTERAIQLLDEGFIDVAY